VSDGKAKGYVRFCASGELAAGAPVVRSIAAKKVGAFRREDGSVYALEMTCKHQGADLSSGAISGGVITCPRHGWRYDLATGGCVSHPTGLPLRFHDAREEDGAVMVSLSPVAAPAAWPMD